jgi:hypothetical protein
MNGNVYAAFRLIPVIGLMGLCFFTGCTPTGTAVTTISQPGKVLCPPIRPIEKLNPLWSLGNADDPEPPEWYRPNSPNRRWLWQMRNPLHNFTFYVIGVADKPTKRTGRFPQSVFAPTGGWNWAFVRHRFVPLPFVSFDGRWSRFYAGWRERGNLGFKFNFKRPTRIAPPANPTQHTATAKLMRNASATPGRK